MMLSPVCMPCPFMLTFRKGTLRWEEGTETNAEGTVGSDSTPGRSGRSYSTPHPTHTLVKAQARVLESGVSGVQRTLGFWPTDVSEVPMAVL